MYTFLQRNRRRLLAAAALWGLGAPYGATAQTNDGANNSLEEITVTAQRRSQSLSNVPLAISAIGQDKIEQFGYTNLESYFRTIPSVALVDGGAQRKQVIIRGIAVDASVVATSLSSVYVDETLVSGGTFGLDPRIFDMERVEILKGPQGTLYGGGSISGSIRYLTNKADTRGFATNFAMDIGHTKGADSGYAVDAMVNVPLIEDKLALRVVAYTADNSGYYRNNYLNLDNQGQNDQTGGRIALRWEPVDTLAITATWFKDDTDQDGWYRATGANWRARNQVNRMTERLTADAEILGLNVEWDLGWASLTSATAQLDFDSYRRVDRTFLGIDRFYDPARLAVLDDTRESTLSEELRLVSAPDAFGRFDWIVGLYYSDIETKVDVGDYIGLGNGFDRNNAGDRFAAAAPTQNFVFPFPAGYASPFGLTETPGAYPDMIYREVSRSEQEQLAFFGELSYRFSDDLVATIGYRRTDTETASGFVNQVGDAGRPVFSETVVVNRFQEPHNNYMGNLSWNLNENALLYARAAEGFRVGTGGAGPTIQPSCQALAERVLGFVPGRITSDTMWGYELGTKLTLADGRVAFNAGVYQNKWTDIQVAVFLEGNATCSIEVIQNVAAATGNGVEFDAAWAATERLQLGFSGSWVDFTLDDDQRFLNAAAGDRLPSHPDLTLSAAADYTLPLKGRWNGHARAEVSYVGTILGGFNADSGLARTEFGKYALTNLRFGVSNEKWDVALYVNNLFDRDALTFQFTDRRQRIESLTARPFTVGINLRTKF